MQEVGWLQGGLVAWEKKGGSDGQVGERKEKERKMGCCIGLQFGLENEGGKWAMMGWNWSWAERNGLE